MLLGALDENREIRFCKTFDMCQYRGRAAL
jgi:hypothetical protein